MAGERLAVAEAHERKWVTTVVAARIGRWAGGRSSEEVSRGNPLNSVTLRGRWATVHGVAEDTSKHT